jgi:Methylase involved in ubiquinone/menaquinone biosynthesis
MKGIVELWQECKGCLTMSENQKDFKFDKRAASYDDGFEGKFSQRFYRLLLSSIDLKPSYTVLDVGCGTGYLLRKMSEQQMIIGYGIDIEANMIDKAKRTCPEMDIQTSPSEKTPFGNNTFDVMTACMAYHHFSDKEGFIKEAARILRTGGCLYIADPFFPFPVRKAINGVLKLFKVAGKFFTAKEMAADFSRFGFDFDCVIQKGIVQVVKLVKTGE